MGNVQEWVANSCADAGLALTSAGEQTTMTPADCRRPRQGHSLHGSRRTVSGAATWTVPASPRPSNTTTCTPKLADLVDIAQQVGAVTRALSWRAALLGAPPRVHRKYDFPVRSWVQAILTLEPCQG